MRSFVRLSALLSFFVVGCLPADPTDGGGCGLVLDDPLAAITVEAAQLQDVTLWQAGLLGGRTEGRATLVVEDSAGNVIDFAAVLEGSHVGLVADASIDVTGGAIYPLALPDEGVNVRNLLGKYEGPHVGVDVVAGFHWRELTNSSKVRLNVTTLSFGLGFVPATWEMLGMQLLNDPAEFVDDGGDCGLFGCGCEGDADGFCDDDCFDDPDCPLDCRDDGLCDPDCDDDDVCPTDGLDDPCSRFPNDAAAGSCRDGLVCVRAVADDDRGTCREACGFLDDGVPVKSTLACGAGSCQVATSAPSGAIEGVVCLANDHGADEQCGAVSDELYGDDACASGFDCRGAGGGALVEGEVLYYEQRCKEICGADDPCAEGEQCVPAGAGPLTCGVVVSAPAADDFEPLGEKHVCNEVEGRRYCDQSMFAGVDSPGVSLCLSSFTTNDGFCFPWCSSPALDRDGDGVLDDEGVARGCGEGFKCTTELALTADIVERLVDSSGVARPCDPAVCIPGEACAACGPGAATCALGACVAPYGSCAAID